MAINHTAGTSPPFMQRETPSAGGSYDALEVTPPKWAMSVDLDNPDGIMRVSGAGTDGATLSADYFQVPAGAGYNLQLQGEDETNQARVFYVACVGTADTVGFSYRGGE